MKDHDTWRTALAHLSPETWKKSMAHESLYRRRELWHLKFYSPNTDLSSTIPQKPLISAADPEYPYRRRFFYLSNRRFALTDRPIAYWAKTWVVATCEADVNFRNNPPKTAAEFHERQARMREEGRRANEPYGYPTTRQITAAAPILDLTRPDKKFVEDIIRFGLCSDEREFFNELVQCRDEAVYPVTQLIAAAAFSNGAKGILYPSARAPQDELNHIIVVYDEALIDLQASGERRRTSGTV